MDRLCLNMIVKNESARIERALDSVAPYIMGLVIVDTGSTDNTKELIQEWAVRNGKGYYISEADFHDWSQARNVALDRGRKEAAIWGAEYLLLMDADMELVVKNPTQFQSARLGVSYDMHQRAGAVHYQNRRLVSVHTSGHYVGVTHEYLDVSSAGAISEDVAYFLDHADGSNRPEKFKRDIKLLKEGLKHEPGNARYMFYLAQSYRDAGKPSHAAVWFARRVEAGGWDEEVWQAQVNLAHCHKTRGNEAEFIRNLLIAYNMRPSRAESMYDLAKFYREKGMNAPALAAAESVMHLPKSTDGLFVNDYVYNVGVKEEASICSFYVPGKKEAGFKVTNELALKRTPYQSAVEGARSNLYYYLPTLAELCPSFKWKKINFVPPEGWVAMNPSVCRHLTALYCNVRCVNYRMDEWGRYLIRHTETGDITNDNPINTRNFILYLGSDAMTETNPWPVYELMPRRDLPREYPLVIGFEDVRLFSWENNLWTLAAVRQLAADGVPEQVISKPVPIKSRDGMIAEHHDIHRMLREPRECQKNWVPIIDNARTTQQFMYRIGEGVNTNGATVFKYDTGLSTGHISGSSQVIPFQGGKERCGWLSVVHEARYIPNDPRRYYFHRFAFYDHQFRLEHLSLPFCFNDRVIEFCAGMCSCNCDLVLSYGFKDEEARIGTVSQTEVWDLLCRS